MRLGRNGHGIEVKVEWIIAALAFLAQFAAVVWGASSLNSKVNTLGDAVQ